ITQVALFFGYNRLPGLAFYNTWSVRFGSMLDDPNGFGLLLALFLGTVFESQIPFKFVLSLFLLLCLVATQSATAIVAVFISLMAYSIVRADLKFRLRTVAIYASIMFTFTACSLGVLSFPDHFWTIYDEASIAYDEIMEVKGRSAESHVSGWTNLSD